MLEEAVKNRASEKHQRDGTNKLGVQEQEGMGARHPDSLPWAVVGAFDLGRGKCGNRAQPGPAELSAGMEASRLLPTCLVSHGYAFIP